MTYFYTEKVCKSVFRHEETSYSSIQMRCLTRAHLSLNPETYLLNPEQTRSKPEANPEQAPAKNRVKPGD